MSDRREFLGRAAILLGTLVVLPAILLGNKPPRDPDDEPAPCEPDGTAVNKSPYHNGQLVTLERELNVYANPHGYTVVLERAENTYRVAGRITRTPVPFIPADFASYCFIIPTFGMMDANARVAAQIRYAKWRTITGVRDLIAARAFVWAN